MTRRMFGWATGAALSRFPLRGRERLRIGIGTYSYHSLALPAMVAQLKALKINEIEMSRGEFMLLSYPTADKFRAARDMFDQALIRCVSYYAATIHDKHELDSAIQFAKLLGAGNITGDATGRELLKAIDVRCTDAGVSFGIHNHFFQTKFPYESPDDVLRALDGLSHTVGATADTGQFASCGYDPADAVRKLGPHLKLVHLKDIAAAHAEENVLLGQGIAKIPQVIDELHKINFSGLVAIEYEKEGPVEEDLRNELAFARKLA